MPALTWLRDAQVIPCSGRPRGPRGWFLDGGVYDAEGQFVTASRHLGEATQHVAPATVPPPDTPVTPGRFLFGGWLQRHFGHLLMTLGRLWAVRELAGQIDGVVFLPLPGAALPRRQDGLRAGDPVTGLLACLGIHAGGAPMRLVAASARFEHLAMPEQILFGAEGTGEADNAAYLAMLRGMREAPGIPDGLVLPRLYVSRRRLPETHGAYLFEDLLEENLAAEGYAILYPERLPVAAQVAAYASAQRLIFAEGSAVHLAIGQIDPATPVAVIARREPVAASLLRDIRAAGLRRAAVISAIRGAVVALDVPRMTAGAAFSALALLDMAQLRDALVSAGLCRGEGWRLPSDGETEARIAAALATRRRLMPGKRVLFVGRDGFTIGAAIPEAEAATDTARAP